MKDFITDCINRVKGDDLYRAELSFKGCTPQEMNEEYGQSGQTRQEIIDGYIRRNEKCDKAIALVNEKID